MKPQTKQNHTKYVKSFNWKGLLLFLIIGILLTTSIVTLIRYSSIQKELKETQKSIEEQEFNKGIMGFLNLFIDEVLNTKGEVSFEERLKLESAVRDLEDDEILTQWNSFVNSQDENEAQTQVRNLLKLLVDKIKVD